MGKILRGRRAMWLAFGDDITVLGKDNEDLSIENNPDIENTKNVLGETIVTHNGYTPSMSNDSYRVREEDAIATHIQTINDTLSDDEAVCGAELIVATLDIEVKDTGEKTATGTGFKVPVIVTVDSDGGDTAGWTLPFTLTENGTRTQGTVSVTDRVPTFTAGTSAASLSD